MSQSAPTEQKRQVQLFSLLFVAAFALMPLVSMLAPRSLAFWPGLTGLVLAALQYGFFGTKPVVDKALLAWAAGIILLATVSSLWALDPEFALERSLKMASILLPGLLLLGVVQAADLEPVRPLVKYIPAMCALSAALLSLELLLNFPFSRLIHGDGIEASNLNRAIIAVLATSFGCYALLRQQRQSRLVAILAVPFFAVTFFTDSQSAQLGFMAALLCFFVFPYSHRWVWYTVGGLLAVGIMCAPFIAIWMFDALAETVTAMPFFGQGGGFGAQRLEIWDAVARKALEQPLTGFGIEATRAVEAFETAQTYRKSVTELHPHNFALQLWIEFGLIGAVAGSAFFVYLFRGLTSCNFDQARVALPTLVFLLPVVTFGYGLWQSWLLGFFVFILVFAKLVMRLYEDKGLEATKRD